VLPPPYPPPPHASVKRIGAAMMIEKGTLFIPGWNGKADASEKPQKDAEDSVIQARVKLA
jgi:hypothetical protein